MPVDCSQLTMARSNGSKIVSPSVPKMRLLLRLRLLALPASISVAVSRAVGVKLIVGPSRDVDDGLGVIEASSSVGSSESSLLRYNGTGRMNHFSLRAPSS